jgi:hypothetical protein
VANFSEHSRKQQVYLHLLEHEDEWIDGPDLANEKVGGSEGLKRLRELRVDLEGSSYAIQMRAHQSPDRDIYQYRITRREAPRSVYAEPAPATPMQASNVTTPDERPPQRRNALDRRGTHIAYDPVTDTYIAVNDTPAPEPEPPLLPGQADMGVVEEVPGLKYSKAPSKLELGRSIPCPRCHGIRRAIKEKDPVTNKAMKDGKIIGYEDWSRDPHKPSKQCPRCDGIGLVPA